MALGPPRTFARGEVLLIALATVAITTSLTLVTTTASLFVVGEIGLDAGVGGAAAAAIAAGGLVARVPTGLGSDHFGFAPFGVGGPLIMIAGLSIFASVATGALILDAGAVVLIAGLLVGFGFSTYSTASTSLIADRVGSSRRARAFGAYGLLQAMAWSVGGGTSFWIANTWGFPSVFAASGGAALVSGVAAVALGRGASERRRRTQRVVGLEFVTLRPAVLGAFIAFGLGAAVTLVPLMSVERGVSNSGLYFVGYSWASIAARSASGAADRWGRQAVILPGLLLASTGLAVCAITTSAPMLIVAGVLFGFGFGVAAPAIQALVVDCSSGSRRGAAVATYGVLSDMGYISGCLGCGALLLSVGYEGTFFLAAALPLFGMLLLTAFSRTRPGRGAAERSPSASDPQTDRPHRC
jgi:MFS family permease